MRRALLFLSLLLVGCRKGVESGVVGTWTSPQGMRLAVASDKTYTDDSGPIHATGIWAVEGNDVVFTPKTVNQRPVAELKARLAQRIGRLPAARQGVAQELLRDIDRPNYVSLSDDGRTLTTDAAKDTNTHGWSPLTKG